MSWPPTELELLKAHAPPLRGFPVFSSKLCKPLVDKGFLKSMIDYHVITDKGREFLAKQEEI